MTTDLKPTESRLTVKTVVLRILIFVLVTLLIVLGILYGVMHVVCKGPSPTAATLFVRSVRETSAIGFLADWFFTPEEIAAMEHVNEDIPVDSTDASLVSVQQTAGSETATDAWGYTDEDGDGLIYEIIHGPTYTGHMLIVLDPSRVILGCAPESIGKEGFTVEEYVLRNDGVAGINGGGFEDDNGMGNGSTPDTAYVHDGIVYCGYQGVGNGFIGIDGNNILHVGITSLEEVQNRGIMEGTGFGPVLVVNGEIADEQTLSSGLNPRTAIGQRSDGAMLLLVVDGRQASSLGATYLDIAEIMYRFGAVNACNLDGGSSSLLYYGGKYVNKNASVIGIRDIPTSFVVLKEGVR